MVFGRTTNEILNSFSLFHHLPQILAQIVFESPFSCWNNIWCFCHLVLNSVAVRPIMTWYMTSLNRHYPFSGQSFLLQQLYNFKIFSCSEVFFSMVLLYGQLFIFRTICQPWTLYPPIHQLPEGVYLLNITCIIIWL